ncbi:MAG TPA: CGNR zinc finger domain-containing protein [Thermoanaerobaculia bacterium]|nr:CGNR zinc finger domain-containing protein [Thermoanaerobaculia bacterium]
MPELELIGGHPALDFVNLAEEDALRVAIAIGLITPHEAQHLLPSKPELTHLGDLRDLLRRIFGAVANEQRPAREDLDSLAHQAAFAARYIQLQPTRNGNIAKEFDAASSGAALIRYRAVDAAIALLTSEELPRIKSCPACAWLFFDASKNRSRRWCRMETCGSANKSRRYYRRTREA